MKILFMSACSNEFWPLAEITNKTKREYCAEAIQFSNPIHAEKDLTKIGWERVIFWKVALSSCDWLFFTGCDAAITNQNISLANLIDPEADFIFACDGCGLQSDSWLMRNCANTRLFLDEVAAMEGSAPTEQDAMQMVLSRERFLSELLAGLPCERKSGGAPASEELIEHMTKILNRSPVRCKIISQRRINAYPMKYYGGTGEEAHSWHPGDFVCHLPGKSLEERIRIFKEILKNEQS